MSDQWLNDKFNEALARGEKLTERLIEAYGGEPDEALRRILRWIAFAAPAGDVRHLVTAFEEVAGSNFRDGYRDGLESAELTEDEREAHENDLGLDADNEDSALREMTSWPTGGEEERS